MKKIDSSKLLKGDIILSTSVEFQSKIIKFFTKSDISHAMICVANGSVMDSTGEGVQARNIDKMFYDDSCAIYAYRLKQQLSPEKIQGLIDYVRSENGAPYTLAGAVGAVVLPAIKGTGMQYCSRLVSRAYASQGVMFTNNPDACTPAQIQKSDLVELIPDAVTDVTQDDLDMLANQGDTTILFRDSTSKLMGELRKIDSSIRVVGDIHTSLLRNPGLDDAIAAALKRTGYLDFWKLEVSRFPWRYDLTTMVQFYHSSSDERKAEIIGYCRSTIKHETDGDFNHWNRTMQIYQDLEIETHLQTFALFKSLYMTLSFGHEQRISHARSMLRVYGK
ncbi:YiiX/YebB-like N1pC/P60 family cysteine hydrolase [Pseudomonas alliivorans]|nr:YiiX/YebB-like N1pC/P60 family cysteine hydrolase [Pseudomonas alliivorans]MEE5056439.1 YiiX/YebB-like N1pC/P60 family cysteine hydrolase [Pseudomonas alliivorans]MEE5135178.1 YiiX/YebB-like N1pC/P60 family cysteine hydrolase [Pseudomonas alliivorans]